MVELIAVLLILAIGLSLAYPSYQQQLIKSRRSTAHQLLLTAANAQQRWYADHFHYATTLKQLSFSAVTEQYYRLSLSHPGCTASQTPSCFTLTATPNPERSQKADKNCPTLMLDHLGRKSPRRCWPE